MLCSREFSNEVNTTEGKNQRGAEKSADGKEKQICGMYKINKETAIRNRSAQSLLTFENAMSQTACEVMHRW